MKGINFLTCLYRNDEVALPVTYQLIQKTQWETDKKTKKQKCVCPKTKNNYFREMVALCIKNMLPFSYVLADSWFSSVDNRVYLKEELGVEFVFPLKENRNVALSKADELVECYINITDAVKEANLGVEVWLPRVIFPVLLCKQVFTNKDGSQGILYLVSSDRKLGASDIQAIYQKRWKVEEYPKSIKSNASFAKSPTKTVRTQSNHLFSCLWAYVKLESLRIQTKMNHFAIKGKLYRAALASAYSQWQAIKPREALA